MIYFMQAEDGGLIKIGTTRNLCARKRSLELQIGRRLNLLAMMAGSFKQEHNLHRRFAYLLCEGREWFQPGDELLEFIDALPAHEDEPEKMTKFIRVYPEIYKAVKQRAIELGVTPEEVTHAAMTFYLAITRLQDA